ARARAHLDGQRRRQAHFEVDVRVVRAEQAEGLRFGLMRHEDESIAVAALLHIEPGEAALLRRTSPAAYFDLGEPGDAARVQIARTECERERAQSGRIDV